MAGVHGISETFVPHFFIVLCHSPLYTEGQAKPVLYTVQVGDDTGASTAELSGHTDTVRLQLVQNCSHIRQSSPIKRHRAQDLSDAFTKLTLGETDFQRLYRLPRSASMWVAVF